MPPARSPLLPKPLLWLLLAVPALLWLRQAAGGTDLEDLLPPTGELSARLLIVALALTPLAVLFPSSTAVHWMIANRRAIGLAAFAYAALHTLFYVASMGDLRSIAAEALAPGIWPGWAALALMLPMALSSNDASVRFLQTGWKRLQRLAYPAALLVLLHWILVHNNGWAAAAHAAPLVALQLWRIARRNRTNQRIAS